MRVKGDIKMGYNWKFRKVFRGEIEGFTITKIDVKRIRDLLEMYGSICKEVGVTNTIIQRSGLTRREIEGFIRRPKDTYDWLGVIEKQCVSPSRVPMKEVRGLLQKYKELILKKLYYGGKITEVIMELWIPNKTQAVRDFIEEIKEEGYMVEDITVLYEIREDVEENRYCIQQLLEKYNQYTEEELRMNMELHGIQVIESEIKERILVVG